MDRIIGIDLGTTNSLVAVLDSGLPKVLPLEDGSLLMPSVVGWDDERGLLVGAPARNRYLLYPEMTVRSVKRHMGDAGWSVRLGGDRYDAPAVSARILERLRQAAAAHLGAVSKAVITVPAYFGDPERRATIEAGKQAGLDVVRILNEPTAAAMAYTLMGAEDQKVLVYDLGGGTFDVSLVEVSGGVCEVLASHGNRQLGGDDFDRRLVDHLADRFASAEGIDLRQDRVAMARLYDAAERAKILLSTEGVTRVREEFVAVEGGKPRHLDMEVSRQEFEAMIRPLLETTRTSVRTVLAQAHVAPKEVARVLLVGGSTRIPAVVELLAEEMGTAPHHEIHPDQAVALGAAVLAGTIAGEAVGVYLVDVSSHSLGVAALGDDDRLEFAPILARNSVLPVSKSRLFYTVHPWQEEVRIRVYEGEARALEANTLLGELEVMRLSPMPDPTLPREVLVRFDYDLNGTLSVTASDRRSRRKVKAVFQPSEAGGEPATLPPHALELWRRLQEVCARDGLAAEVRARGRGLMEEARSLVPGAAEAWAEQAAALLYEHGEDPSEET